MLPLRGGPAGSSELGKRLEQVGLHVTALLQESNLLFIVRIHFRKDNTWSLRSRRWRWRRGLRSRLGGQICNELLQLGLLRLHGQLGLAALRDLRLEGLLLVCELLLQCSDILTMPKHSRLVAM